MSVLSPDQRLIRHYCVYITTSQRHFLHAFDRLAMRRRPLWGIDRTNQHRVYIDIRNTFVDTVYLHDVSPDEYVFAHMRNHGGENKKTETAEGQRGRTKRGKGANADKGHAGIYFKYSMSFSLICVALKFQTALETMLYAL